MQNAVSEVLYTWCFPYSTFWSAGQWGAIGPPPPPLASVLSATGNQKWAPGQLKYDGFPVL